MSKFYAVRCGRKTGVFTTWAECQEQVKGFSGAVFKSFLNREDAENYVSKVPEDPVFDKEIPDNKTPYAFVDGSFNDSTNEYGFGGILFDGKDYHIIRGRGYDKEMLEMRNVAGEIQGVMEAVNMAKQLNIVSLDIYYDYEGIRAWAEDAWAARKTGTKRYAQFMKDETMHFTFRKVTAHTGVVGNEYADVLAKSAIGINLTRAQRNIYSDAMKLCGEV